MPPDSTAPPERRRRIGIGLPVIAMRPKSIITLCSNLMRVEGERALLVCEGAYVQHNRNLLVKAARENECTHLFFMDHDMMFPPETINHLLAHDVDIVGGAYNMRGVLPRERNAWIDGVRVTDETMPKTLFKSDALGCGCLLMKMSIFDVLEPPYFKIDEDADGQVTTEDIYFCNKARKAGFAIWCDPAIQIGHVGEFIY